ncbi:MAG: aminoacyl-tRNA hydrolase [Phycisphaerales bacterium]|nr:aminoacyl-tRNA hydrolase [Phycisphaerales bacterium]
MRLIVGLGNPGIEYDRTRHNAGFMAMDRLARRLNTDFSTQGKSKFQGLVLDVKIAGEKCLLVKPMTYMNRSGFSVVDAAAFYKIEPVDVLVIVDDVALPVGKLRLRGEGSAGGHNGLADIQRALGTANYNRLRIGIDPPGRIPQVDYVLGRFSPDQLIQLDPALDLVVDCVECWIAHGLAKAMTRYNA